MKNTIFLLLPTAITVRNFARGGLIDQLASNENFRIICITPFKDSFSEETRKNITIIHTNLLIPWRIRLLHACLRRRFDFINENASIKSLRTYPLYRKFRSRMLELLAYPFPRSIWLYKLIRKLERYSVKTPKKITDLFELYKPCAVISTRPNHLEDYFYLFHASKLMVPTLGVIKSWDNVTTKGYMPVRCDKCTVWNDSMARSLSILHNYLVNDVVVTGAPQFDIYAEEINILRSVFFDSIGLNTKKKTVLYATSPPSINSDDPEILRDLSQALFEENIQIIARLHQMDDLERYVNISNPNLVFQVSGSGMCSVNTDARLCSKEFLNELRDTIYFSDLVVNTFSTITLDAVALNRPVININFDFKKKKYSNSVTRFNSFVHYQQIFSTGAAIQAKSFNELLNLIKNMSTISKISERERDQIKEELCYRVDGNSTQRLVEVIVEVAE